jgi:hypothetical protein
MTDVIPHLQAVRDHAYGYRSPGRTSGTVTGEVSLQTWALKPKFTDYVQGVIDVFQKKYPGVHVTWLDQPADGT